MKTKSTIKKAHTLVLDNVVNINAYEAIKSIAEGKTLKSKEIKGGTNFSFIIDGNSPSNFELLILRKSLRILGYNLYDELYHEVGNYVTDENGSDSFMFDEGIYVSDLPFSVYEQLDECILMTDQQLMENKSYSNELKQYLNLT